MRACRILRSLVFGQSCIRYGDMEHVFHTVKRTRAFLILCAAEPQRQEVLTPASSKQRRAVAFDHPIERLDLGDHGWRHYVSASVVGDEIRVVPAKDIYDVVDASTDSKKCSRI